MQNAHNFEFLGNIICDTIIISQKESDANTREIQNPFGSVDGNENGPKTKSSIHNSENKWCRKQQP